MQKDWALLRVDGSAAQQALRSCGHVTGRPCSADGVLSVHEMPAGDGVCAPTICSRARHAVATITRAARARIGGGGGKVGDAPGEVALEVLVHNLN